MELEDGAKGSRKKPTKFISTPKSMSQQMQARAQKKSKYTKNKLDKYICWNFQVKTPKTV